MKYIFVVIIKDMQLTVEADFNKESILFNGKKAPHNYDWTPTLPDSDFSDCGSCELHCAVASNILHLCSFFDELSSIDHMELSIIQRTGTTTKSYPSSQGMLILLLSIFASSGCRCFGHHRWAWQYYNFTIKIIDYFYFMLSVGFVEALVFKDPLDPEQIKEKTFRDIERIRSFTKNLLTHIRTRAKEQSDAHLNALIAVLAIVETLSAGYDNLLQKLEHDIKLANRDKSRPSL